MTTKGNLELRIGTETLCSSADSDGYKVYKAIGKLATFLNNNHNPSPQEYKDWFKQTSEELSFVEYEGGRLGGVPCEVVIDTSRKLILYNANNEDEDNTIKTSTVRRLAGRHKYQFFRYRKLVNLKENPYLL